eukprot:scaffold5144_cov105-Isochrysis_galbana.AAC.6
MGQSTPAAAATLRGAWPLHGARHQGRGNKGGGGRAPACPSPRFDEIEPHMDYILSNVDQLAPHCGALLRHLDALLLYCDDQQRRARELGRACGGCAPACHSTITHSEPVGDRRCPSPRAPPHLADPHLSAPLLQIPSRSACITCPPSVPAHPGSPPRRPGPPSRPPPPAHQPAAPSPARPRPVRRPLRTLRGRLGQRRHPALLLLVGAPPPPDQRRAAAARRTRHRRLLVVPPAPPPRPRTHRGLGVRLGGLRDGLHCKRPALFQEAGLFGPGAAGGRPGPRGATRAGGLVVGQSPEGRCGTPGRHAHAARLAGRGERPRGRGFVDRTAESGERQPGGSGGGGCGGGGGEQGAPPAAHASLSPLEKRAAATQAARGGSRLTHGQPRHRANTGAAARPAPR